MAAPIASTRRLRKIERRSERKPRVCSGPDPGRKREETRCGVFAGVSQDRCKPSGGDGASVFILAPRVPNSGMPMRFRETHSQSKTGQNSHLWFGKLFLRDFGAIFVRSCLANPLTSRPRLGHPSHHVHRPPSRKKKDKRTGHAETFTSKLICNPYEN